MKVRCLIVDDEPLGRVRIATLLQAVPEAEIIGECDTGSSAIKAIIELEPDLLFLEKGLAAYDEVKRGSLSAMDFACRSLLPNPAAASAEQKSRAATELFAIIVQTDSDVTRTSFLSEIAGFLRVAPGALERDLRAFQARQSGGRFANPNAARTQNRGGPFGR